MLHVSCQKFSCQSAGTYDSLEEALVLLCSEKTQEGCCGLRGENPGAFPKAGPTFQQPFSLPENAQTLAFTAFHAAGKSVNTFSSSVEICWKTLPAANFFPEI